MNSRTRAARRLTGLVGRRALPLYRLTGPCIAGWCAVVRLTAAGPRVRWLSMTGRTRFRYTPPRSWVSARETMTPDEIQQLTHEFYHA